MALLERFFDLKISKTLGRGFSCMMLKESSRIFMDLENLKFLIV